MSEDKDRYRPRRFEEIEGNGISLINEPVPPEIETEVRILRSSSTRAIVGMVASLHETAAAALARPHRKLNVYVRAKM
jgi:hypothetical protein